MFLKPDEIFLRAGCIDHEQKFLLASPVNDQVINDAPTLVQQKGVLTRSNIELAYVVCEHAVEPLASAHPVHNQLSHVRNIKDPDVVSHRLMFLDDARVLQRHEPSGERNYSRAEPDMFLVKRCFA